MKLENRLITLETRVAPMAQSDAKRRLEEFLATRCGRFSGKDMTEGWLAAASPADVLAAGMNHATDLPPFLAGRLRLLAREGAPSVAKIAQKILEYAT